MIASDSTAPTAIQYEAESGLINGGRAAAGYKGKTGDCTCRAIAIAAQLPYQTVYDMLNEHAANQRITKRQAEDEVLKGLQYTFLLYPNPMARAETALPGRFIALFSGIHPK